MSTTLTLNKLYGKLLSGYGNQGWWPLYDSSTGRCAYGNASSPDFSQAFEVAVGAILAQNIAWSNVEKAIVSLHDNGLMSPQRMKRADDADLAVIIRSCGYYNQKVRSLRALLQWLDDNRERFIPGEGRVDPGLRKSLLSVRGIGPETADSILLYGLGYRYFVIDAYTMRIITRLGFVEQGISYHDMQAIFHRRFRGDIDDYREFHALIVRHGNEVCRPRPGCEKCLLRRRCAAGATEFRVD